MMWASNAKGDVYEMSTRLKEWTGSKPEDWNNGGWKFYVAEKHHFTLILAEAHAVLIGHEVVVDYEILHYSGVFKKVRACFSPKFNRSVFLGFVGVVEELQANYHCINLPKGSARYIPANS